MKYCGKCGKETSEDTRFCQSCGQAFLEPQNDSTVVPNHNVRAGHQPNEPAISSPPKAKAIRFKMLIGAVLAVILAAGGFWGWQNYGTEARAQAKLDLGIKYLTENNYEKAVLAFDEAIKIDPKEIKGYQGLAKTYILQGKYDDAKATYERGTTAVKPEYQIVLRLSLAGMYIDKGELPQAEAFFQEIINGNKSCVNAYVGLSLVYQQQDKKDKALAILEQCTKENSQDYQAYNALARYYAATSDNEKALQTVVKALELEANQQEAYLILETLYKGKFAELIGKAGSATKSKTSSMLKFYAYYGDKKYSEALSQYHTVLEQDINNHKARVLAAICLLQNGQKEEANRIIEKIIQEKPNVSIMADVARYYHLAGDDNNFKVWMGKVHEKDEISSETALALAMLNIDTERVKYYATQYLVFAWEPVAQAKKEMKNCGIPTSAILSGSNEVFVEKDINDSPPTQTNSSNAKETIQANYETLREYASKGMIPEVKFAVGTPTKTVLNSLGQPESNSMERAGLWYLRYGNISYQYFPYRNWARHDEVKLDINTTSITAVCVREPEKAFGIELGKIKLNDIETIFGKTKYGVCNAATEGDFIQYEFPPYTVFFTGERNGRVYGCKVFLTSFSH